MVFGAAEAAGVMRCLKAGTLSGGDQIGQDYEAALCAAFDAPHAVACSSGTAAIYIALSALGVGRGDEVILPPTAPAMTALPVLALGASARFADTRPGGFGLDARDVERRMTARTKAVVEVPMWGYASDLGDLRDRCLAAGVALVEDAAQAHGSAAAGRSAGTGVTVGAFSTHARKLIATGEGGFLLTDCPDLTRAAQRIRSLGCSDGGGEAFGERFGLNFKLPGLLAAVGLAQVQRLRHRVAARNAVADSWLAALAEVPGVTVVPRPEVHNCYGLAVQVAAGARRRLDDALGASGILTDTKAYRYRPLYEAALFPARPDCPHAAALVDELIVLPCHEGVGLPVIERACRVLAG
jgi:dTDP-4-amino-4,6-dideoxygalactose transaminase